jgi:dynein intermediate chain
VLYNKEIQTAAFDSDSSTEDEDAARHRLANDRARELEAERLRERELEEESLQLDREIEEAIRGPRPSP